MAISPGATSNWSDYRTRSRTFWCALIVGSVSAIACAEFVLIERLGVPGLLWPLAAWVAALAWASHRWQDFICPRCSHHFFRRNPPLLPLRAKRCVHCLLSKD